MNNLQFEQTGTHTYEYTKEVQSQSSSKSKHVKYPIEFYITMHTRTKKNKGEHWIFPFIEKRKDTPRFLLHNFIT